MNSSHYNWHILVVEYEPDEQEIASNLLGYFGITSDLVFHAEEALALLTSKNYTAVVVDLMLPGIDGLALLGKIKSIRQPAAPPCLAVTAYYSPTIKRKAREAGFDGFYPKPLDYDGFIKELHRVCQLKL